MAITLSTRRMTFEVSLRSLSINAGRLDVFARFVRPDLRWAWLALVKEGASLEAVAGPVEATVSWGMTDGPAWVWAWRRARKAVAAGGASVGEG